MSRSRYISVTVDVDIDLDDIDTDDLVAELERRNVSPGLTWDGSALLLQMHDAFKLGNTERALELSRQYVCNSLGRIM